MTGKGVPFEKFQHVLFKTANSIINSQNTDGGFSESLFIRPRNIGNMRRAIGHVWGPNISASAERMKYCLNLLRPKHDRIHTHWSKYSREWHESDLWDSWFRLLTVARIDCAFNKENKKRWGLIKFPGIGYCCQDGRR